MMTNDVLYSLVSFSSGQFAINSSFFSSPEFTNELMTAQCFLFFVAGFDTSSLVLSMTLLELALNRDVQDKLQEEIDHYFKENGETITYEMIQQMKYLHKVVQGR